MESIGNTLRGAQGTPLGGLEPGFVSGECETHGPYNVWAPFVRVGVSYCPKCAEAKCREEFQRVLSERSSTCASSERLVGAIGIPKRFRACTLSSFEVTEDWQRKVHSAVREIADEFKGHHEAGSAFLAYGPPGTGKTHLAVGLCVEVATRYSMKVRYWHAGDLLGAFLDTRHEGGYAKATRLLETPDFVVIDEVMLNQSDAVRGIVQQIIEARYAAQRPLMLVGNYESPDALLAFVGDRCADRLIDQRLRGYRFSGPSRRGL